MENPNVSLSVFFSSERWMWSFVDEFSDEMDKLGVDVVW